MFETFECSIVTRELILIFVVWLFFHIILLAPLLFEILHGLILFDVVFEKLTFFICTIHSDLTVVNNYKCNESIKI